MKITDYFKAVEGGGMQVKFSQEVEYLIILAMLNTWGLDFLSCAFAEICCQRHSADLIV